MTGKRRWPMHGRLIGVTLAGCLLAAAIAAPSAPAPGTAPIYDAAGKLVAPEDYREWIFLSAGLDMSYTDTPKAGAHVFDNVFAPPAAYRAFKRDGVWPDKTVLILENRAGGSAISINKSGVTQTGAVVGLEAHVKDVARFKSADNPEGWGFFRFAGAKQAALIGYDQSCYACHRQHAAADTTFVQFYPTLLPFVKKIEGN